MNFTDITFRWLHSSAMVPFILLLLGFHSTLVMADGQSTFVDSGQRLGNLDSYSPALGDVDGDGDLDAWVANYGAFSRHPNRVWLNDGNGNFSDSGQSLGNSSSRVSVLGDFDGDGDLDVFVGNGLEQPDTVWQNDGNGLFSDTGQRLGRVATDDLKLGDLDSDGHLDAFVASASARPFGNPANLVFFGSATGIFTDSGQRLGNLISESVALGDVDNDGDLDAFVGNRAPSPDKVWINNGLGAFTDSGQSLSTGQSFRVALGDVDNDGDLDAFIANFGSPNTVWLNNGQGVFTDSGQRMGAANSFDVQLVDLDADNDLDAFVANSANQPNTVWLNNGSGVYTDSGQRLGASNSRRASLADLDGDNDLDAFVANSFQPNTVWFLLDCSRAVASAEILWPPNHNFVPINVLGVNPDVNPITITIDSIFQDEAVDTTGDGKFVPDGQGVGTDTALIRAERSGSGNGRVYHIGFTADDGQGNTCTGEVSVGVPRDRDTAPIDDGKLFDSTVP